MFFVLFFFSTRGKAPQSQPFNWKGNNPLLPRDMKARGCRGRLPCAPKCLMLVFNYLSVKGGVGNSCQGDETKYHSI